MKDLIRLLFDTSLLTSGFNLDDPTPVKDLIRLLVDTSLLSSGFNLDEPTRFVGRIHHMIMLGLSLDDDDGGLGDDEGVPPLEEVEGAGDEASKMEEVNRILA